MFLKDLGLINLMQLVVDAMNLKCIFLFQRRFIGIILISSQNEILLLYYDYLMEGVFQQKYVKIMAKH